MRSFISSHRALSAALGVGGVAVVVFVLVWFQPQKLLIEKTVQETLPPRAEALKPTGTEAAPSQPKTLAEGMFRSLDHETTGTALVVEQADGSRIVRFQGLNTSNGPDLRVWLSSAASDSREFGGAAFADLGELKGNRGDQNYEVPAGVDLAKFRSVVIWCRRFKSPFGVAPLATG